MCVLSSLPSEKATTKKVLMTFALIIKKLGRDLCSESPDSGSPPLHPAHPGDNPGVYRWFIKSLPIQMPPPGGGICGRLT